MVYSQAKQAGLHMHQYWSYSGKIYGKIGKDIWRNIFRELDQRGCEWLRFLVLVCIKILIRQYPKYLQVGVLFFIGIFGKGLCQVFVGISLSKEVDMRSPIAYKISHMEGIILHPQLPGFDSLFQILIYQYLYFYTIRAIWGNQLSIPQITIQIGPKILLYA